MILKRLKLNSPINLFLVPIAIVAFWANNLRHPSAFNFYPSETENILFSPIYKLVQHYPLAQVIISILLAIGLALLIQLINDQYLFIRIKSKLPALIFSIIIGGFIWLHTLHPVYFGALFILLAIFRLFAIFEKKKAYSAIFDVGFLWGIGALFYFNMTFILPALLFSIVLLGRETRWRDFIILLFGFILPFFFVLSYGFLFDQSQEMLAIFKKNIITFCGYLWFNKAFLFYLGAILFFILAGSISVLGQFDTKKISSRKYFSVLFGIFVFSIAVFFAVPGTSYEIMLITAIPTTYLVSNMFVFMNKRFWSELLFFVLLIAMIVVQFI